MNYVSVADLNSNITLDFIWMHRSEWFMTLSNKYCYLNTVIDSNKI